MKHSKQHNHARGTQDGSQSVRFEFSHPTATTVCLAGTFNDWSPVTKPLHPLGGGRWIKDTVLPPGIYEYCLVVDNEWMPDPRATESVANPFGGVNSLLRVTNPAG
jgi:1,4-alpha-glucan branching enzyme